MEEVIRYGMLFVGKKVGFLEDIQVEKVVITTIGTKKM
jgi:hypothetical protein